MTQCVKNPSAMQNTQETWVRSLGGLDSLAAGEYQADERQVSRGSAGEYQADEQAGVARLSWRVSG